ncbi:hypothetical protein M422DRAFT_27352 [Sphaerobolus stellatus SS14]|nr:hypothetical protein M422DRAFT_27352 [Sphaerobolus stellatus SS14]
MSFPVTRVVIKLIRTRPRYEETPCPHCGAYRDPHRHNKKDISESDSEAAEMLDPEDMAW